MTVRRPGGRLAFLFRTTADLVSWRSFPPEVYRLRSGEEVRGAIQREGLRRSHNANRPEPALAVLTRPRGP